MNNIKVGNKTEKSASGLLRAKGYFVYNCPRSNTGAQPVDLIAIKGGKTYIVWLIDGKHVRENEVSFPLTRIEPNQIISMKYANEFAGIHLQNLGFAVQFERTGDIYWLPYEKVVEMTKNNEKSINLKEMKLFTEVLDNEQCD